MFPDHLIIDGNNLIHLAKGKFLAGTRDFAAARRSLATQIDELAGGLAGKVTIVFDGTIGGRDDSFKVANLDIIYSESHVTADRIIERMVSSSREPAKILVVTSDRSERHTVEAAGGEVTSCSVFVEMMEDSKKALKSGMKKLQQQSKGPTLGDFFPEVTNRGKK
ncbi:MAG: hypothetical protein C0404_08170 [Verrucomicrobia bacterium]|nr:hypothetical protein [Verrucomicrobiota bacterium]